MKLLIIIGLPGSGKTTYFNQNLSDKFKFYDDFVSNIFDGKLVSDLKKKENDICVADPRLCNFQIFNRAMNIFLQYISKNDIDIILFENDKDKCIINANNRGSRFVTKSIEFNSFIYNYDNYSEYNCKLVPVYSIN